MTNCPTRAFDGCNCAPGQCQSFAVRLDECRQREKAATADYMTASIWSARILVCCIGVALYMLLFGLAALSAENGLRQDDLINQEITGQMARVMIAMELRK
ncbi:hypothetical protein [Agrobacterium tumefaciens]|uniref:hypothetical protein n=1 Tax=Agrobacterium tumefaciens TaxID=358 RepID=UPI0021D362D2|nr:hypothetical protein [Agrobacterium tumefaciens]UXS23105.1 hypothetical protein FY153_01060 [Agrobacterium tumefaciens]